ARKRRCEICGAQDSIFCNSTAYHSTQLGACEPWVNFTRATPRADGVGRNSFRLILRFRCLLVGINSDLHGRWKCWASPEHCPAGLQELYDRTRSRFLPATVNCPPSTRTTLTASLPLPADRRSLRRPQACRRTRCLASCLGSA